MIDSVEVSNLLEKLKMFVEEENKLFISLYEQLQKVRSNYETNNKNSIEIINLELEKKFDFFNKTYSNYISKLKEILSSYEETANEVAKSFGKLGEDNGKFGT